MIPKKGKNGKTKEALNPFENIPGNGLSRSYLSNVLPTPMPATGGMVPFSIIDSTNSHLHPLWTTVPFSLPPYCFNFLLFDSSLSPDGKRYLAAHLYVPVCMCACVSMHVESRGSCRMPSSDVLMFCFVFS